MCVYIMCVCSVCVKCMCDWTREGVRVELDAVNGGTQLTTGTGHGAELPLSGVKR